MDQADWRDEWVEEDVAPFLLDQMCSPSLPKGRGGGGIFGGGDEGDFHKATYRSIPFLVMTRLLRSLSGLNFVGIDSHVLRPIITVFWVF